MSREEIENVVGLFPDDDALRETLVHEKKREAVAGLSRQEIVDRMVDDYTYINRPVAVRGRAVACGPLRLNRATYDARFS